MDFIFKDEFFVAINKPNGLLVHRSNIASDASEFALQLVRDALQQYVYPVHRLDRKTSGVLLFGLSSEIARKIQYPQYEKEMGIQGTIYTQFIIERNGSISEIKVLRNVPGSKNFEKEAIRILKSLDHQFQPAMHNGRKVRCRFTLPIKFVLQ